MRWIINIITAFLFGTFLFSMVSGCGESQIEAAIRDATNEWVKGHNHSAIERFKAILEEHPSGKAAEEILFRLGEIHHLSLEKSQQALVYFQEVLEMNPDGPFGYDAQKYIAEIIEFTFKDYDQAILEYQNLINNFEKFRENGDHQYRIASVYYKKENYEQAYVELEELLEKYPDNQWAEESRLKTIEILYALGRCPETQGLYDTFIQERPNNKFKGEMQFVIASCLEDDGRLKEAYKKFKLLENGYAYPAVLDMKLAGLEKRIKKKR